LLAFNKWPVIDFDRARRIRCCTTKAIWLSDKLFISTIRRNFFASNLLYYSLILLLDLPSYQLDKKFLEGLEA
jgi:hypothetical protein